MRQVSLHLTAQPLRPCPFDRMHPGFLADQVPRAAGMIGVEVGDDDLPNIARPDADRPQLRADLVVGLHPKL